MSVSTGQKLFGGFRAAEDGGRVGRSSREISRHQPSFHWRSVMKNIGKIIYIYMDYVGMIFPYSLLFISKLLDWTSTPSNTLCAPSSNSYRAAFYKPRCIAFRIPETLPYTARNGQTSSVRGSSVVVSVYT